MRCYPCGIYCAGIRLKNKAYIPATTICEGIRNGTIAPEPQDIIASQDIAAIPIVWLNPVGGESWTSGNSVTLKWSSNWDAPMNIHLCYGSQCPQIFSNIPNTGSVSWIVPYMNTTAWLIPAKRVTLSHGTGRAYDRQNLRKMAEQVSDKVHFPLGSTIMINREGYIWQNFFGPETADWRADARDSFVDLILWYKALRPDCQFGFFGITDDNNDVDWLHSNRTQRDAPGQPAYERILAWHTYTKPIADLVDVLYLPLYLTSNKPASEWPWWHWRHDYPYSFDTSVIDWLEHVIYINQRDYPGKRIIPLLWYENFGNRGIIAGEYAASGGTVAEVVGGAWGANMVWTPELLERLFVSGPLWKRMLEIIVTGGSVPNYTSPETPNYKVGISEIASWGEGGLSIPWSDDYPWWVETLAFF
jgi:hypothetical protein